MKAKDSYVPINCHFYDHFEAAIVQKRQVTIEYQDTNQKQRRVATRLKDLQTIDKEEFLTLEDGTAIRLDKVLSIDGKTPPGHSEQPINCIN